MDVYCGIDWAEDHHDIAVVDRDGKLLARRRISDDAGGLATLLALLAEHGDTAGDPVPGRESVRERPPPDPRRQSVRDWAMWTTTQRPRRVLQFVWWLSRLINTA